MTALDLINRLGLAPHPEGGWYRETWRAPATAGERGAGTAILFLLRQGERSHWHRIDACEVWVFQAGAPLELRTVSAAGGVVSTRLGLAEGEAPQFVVQPYQWQAARSLGDFSLAACVVTPAFSFDAFELAPPGWEPDGRGDVHRPGREAGTALPRP